MGDDGYFCTCIGALSVSRSDHDAAIASLRGELEAAQKKLAEAEVDARRWNALLQSFGVVFLDDGGLWVASWKRAIGDVSGIIRAQIDAILAQKGGV